MKLPEEIAQLAVLVLHTLFSEIKPLQKYKGKYKLLVNHRCAISENFNITDNMLINTLVSNLVVTYP